MTTETLAVRLTHGYVGTYKHLDKWEDIGTIQVLTSNELPPIEEEEGDASASSGHEIYAIVRTFHDSTDREIAGALIDTYSSHDCAHDYDCCGCRSFSARNAKRVTGDLWRVEVWSWRNY